MISKFKNLYMKLLVSNKVMSISNVIMIAIVTCIITLLFNVSLNAENQLKLDNREMIGLSDLEVGYNGESNKFITADIEKNILGIKEIEKISPAAVTSLDVDGMSIYTLGLYSDELSKSKYKFNSDLVGNGVAINDKFSEAKALKVGDSIEVNGQALIVDEIFKDDTNNASGINMMIVNKDFLEGVVREPIGTKFAMIKVKENVSKVSEELASIDKSFEILIADESDYLKENMESLRNFLIFIGILVFAICGIFVISNLQHYLYKYTKDFAIMKMIGSSSNQVFYILFMQGLVLNILGIGLGIIFHCIFTSIILTQYKILMMPIVITSLLGFVVLQITLIFPAYKTLKILPMKALTNREMKPKKKGKGSIKYVSLVLGFGVVVALKNFVFAGGTNSFFECIFAFVLIFISSLVILKIKLPDILSKLENMFGKASISKISIMTMQTQFVKNFMIIVSIVILLCMNIMGGSIVKILEINNEKYYRNEYLEDIVLNSNTDVEPNIANDIFQEVKGIDGVSSYMRLDGGSAQVKVNDLDTRVMFEVGTLKEMSENKIIKSYNAESKDVVVVTDKFAKKNNIKIGEKINLRPPMFENKGVSNLEYKKFNVNLEVIDIVPESITRYSEIMIDLSNNEIIQMNELFFDRIFINTNGLDVSDDLREIKSMYSGLKWQSLDEALYNSSKEINDRWEIFNIAIILILLTTILGIVNAIKDNMNASRKEYAILRSMQFTRKDLIKMLIIQMIIFISIGVIVGLGLGSIGSILMTSVDGFNIILPRMNLLIISAIATLFVIGTYLVPYIIKFSRIELNRELSREEG